MIFVTVGTQLAFDRLVNTVDQWAEAAGRDDVFGQVGPCDPPPRHMEWSRSLQPSEFTDRVASADVIVAHAGMGTIINALKLRKPILVMPRRAELGEQRNDHQLATVRELHSRGRIHAAMNETELRSMLERIDELPPLEPIGDTADDQLISFVRAFVHGS